ncbi:hypothetical protein BDN70DRAFT_275073 [Pholiota conissans]|uniref:Uncharacterized protein n=1 Tax=Pholiota conissans TaxID=109636 RepID=A0A9P5YTE3_9AGAR|nr:hypothetical protein BDN70DRAFT_275073 [Pholiota conissans]
MSTNDKNNAHSDPITIPFAAARGRSRSMSVSSSSSGSTSSGSELPTPASTSVGSHRLSIPSPSTSPILSYFLAQSSPTTKTPVTATFPFKRKFGTTPVFEEGEPETEIPVAAHARRASANVRFSPQNTSAYSEASTDRGSNLLRRLSLSSAVFVKPQLGPDTRAPPPSPPPNSAVSPTSPSHTAPFKTKPRRSATITGDAQRPRRAPSPMGERILTGHFDGFN